MAGPAPGAHDAGVKQVGPVLVVVLVAGCPAPGDAPESEAPADSAPVDTVPDPSDWSYEDPGETAGTAVAADLEAALAVMLEDARGRDPSVWMGSYLDQLRWGTGGCPEFAPTRPGEVRWEGECTSDRKASFDGWAVSWWDREVVGAGGEDCATILFFFGFLRITDPGGTAFDAWGTVGEQDCVDDAGVRSVRAAFDGDFAWPTAEGRPWQADAPVSWTWSVEEAAEKDGGAVALVLGGGAEALGGPIVAGELVDLRFDRTAACLTEPSGSARFWDAAGAGYVLSFDPELACDGCGAASSLGVSIGTVCQDWTPWFTWEGRPWW
jgi:hypothetical protein